MDIEALCRTAIRDVSMCALDFETTQVEGVSGALAIIEIAAQRFRRDEVTAPEFHTLVNPKCQVRAFDTGVSGITDEMVAGKPTFPEISDRLFSYMEDHVVVAHNAAFDRRALDSQCARDGSTVPTMIMVDTAAILRKMVSLSSYTLHSACRHFGIEQVEAHRASGDCQAVRKLFVALGNALAGTRGIRQFEQLCRFLGLKLISEPVQRELF